MRTNEKAQQLWGEKKEISLTSLSFFLDDSLFVISPRARDVIFGYCNATTATTRERTRTVHKGLNCKLAEE